jgi:hypothetical protein
MASGCDHFLLRHRLCIKEGLHRRLAKAPSSLMWPLLIIYLNPTIEIGLQLFNGTVHLFAERDTVKFVEHGFVEALTDTVGLRALGLCPGVINILDREVELILVPLRVAAVLAATIGQHAQQLDLVAVEEWDHSIIQEVGRGDWGLAIIELGAADLGIGIDEGLLIDASHPL